MALRWLEDVSLAAYTTLKTGGVARYFALVRTVAEVGEAVRFAKQNGLPLLIIGGGSNLLVADRGYPGVVVKLAITGRHYEPAQDGSVLLTCGAGETFDEVVADTVDCGYWGLENLSAIPGTVGATPVQNVGAYGVEVSDLITTVEVYDTHDATVRVLDNVACHFGYRDSFFKTLTGASLIITAVTFRLSSVPTPKLAYADLARVFAAGEVPALVAIRDAIITIRSGKFPDWRVLGTAGSFFKNPIITRQTGEALRARYPDLPLYDVDAGHVKLALGYVLDKLCTLKGYRVGAVGLYDRQALVLVNYDEATTTEIRSFARAVAEKVFAVTGIVIEPEVRYVE